MRWLNKNVMAIGVTSFFNDFGHEMTTAILPAFLASLGGSAATLGFIDGLASAMRNIARALGGWYSDRIGKRKPLMNTGYLATALGVGSLAFAYSWITVLISRVAIWTGRGTRESARDALLLDSSDPQDYGKIFGFHRAMDTLGAIVGPAVAYGLMNSLAPRTIFMIAFLPSFVSYLTVLVFVKDVTVKRVIKPLNLIQSLAELPLAYRSFLFAVGMFRLGNFASSILILRATQLLTPAHGAVVAGGFSVLLYTLRNFFYAASSFPMGLLGDNLGRKNMLALGYCFMAGSSAGFMISTDNLFVLTCCFAIAGIAVAFVDGLERAVAGDLLPTHVRGTGYGALAAINGFGLFVASTTVGWLLTNVSAFAAFGYSTVLCLAGVVVLCAVNK